MRLILQIFILLFFLRPLFGQDTIRIDTSYFYTSINEPMRGKEFASRVKFAREDITFSNTHKRIEYCYYYDNERICYGETYRLIGDSILQIGDSTNIDLLKTWNYRKNNDGRYTLYQFTNGLYQVRKTKSLIPLEIPGQLYSMTGNKSDTLWIENYGKGFTNYSYPKTEIKNKIHKLIKVDKPPMFLNGKPLPDTIYHQRTDGCYSESFYKVWNMRFIVDTEGNIKNIEQGMGTFDMDYCPYYILELITIINQFGTLSPAIKNGQPVNVEYIISIEMNTE